MENREKLFEMFPPVSTKEWMDKINSDLKGADFNEKLVWETNEGFEVKPFYRMEDIEDLPYINTLPGEFPYVRGTKKTGNNWLVRQNIEVSDYKKANRKALSILMKGIESIGFIITDPGSISKNNISLLLRDIHFEIIEVNFLCPGKEWEILDHIIVISAERGLNSDSICGAIEYDLTGRLTVNGKSNTAIGPAFDHLATLVAEASVLPGFRIININTTDFNNTGADIVQELAFAISMGNEYLSQLTDRGLDADLAASKIRFTFVTGSNYFFEIAKLRAARLLWTIVQKRYNKLDSELAKMNIHCVTDRNNMTVIDPWTNMLRTQTEAMSAVLGGADSLIVEPFDVTLRQPDEFSERIARNQQLILKEEAWFDKVADPSGGSYYIENLTKLIADNAWKLFLEVEEKGGFLASLKEGFIRKKEYEADIQI